MKRIVRYFATLMLAGASVTAANAQYYEIANQIPSLISPALSGSLNYKGFIEASGLAGVGQNRANFLGVPTSQGFKYSSWFFMGAGLGVDVVMTNEDNLQYDGPGNAPDWYRHSSGKTKAMIPVFSDFRFFLGSQDNINAFIDLKLGAAWLLGSSYLQLHDSYLSNSTQFYFRPSIGMRVPIDKARTNRAVNISVTYQLLTSDNNYGWNTNSVTLNNIGVTVGYEW